MRSVMSLLAPLGALVGCLWLANAAPIPNPRLLLNPYPNKPRVTFAWDGTFKITVFSDLHYGENPWDAWGPQQDVNSTALMRLVIPDEAPDYIVLNGDLITGENTFKDNSTDLINEIMVPINEAHLPFSSTHGNHDNEANITHLMEIIREQEVAPLSYTRTAPPGIGGEEGPGTYWVPVYEHEWDPAPVLIMWFFDSRSGNTYGANSTPVPDWVDSSVAGWIESETKQMEAVWGPGEDRGAIAFVHIPPNAIQALQTNLNSTQDPGLNADLLGVGSTQASGSPSEQGNDEPFWTALNTYVKNLHVVVSGHDHGNEWCKREPTQDVIFCFDKHSGYGGYSSPGWGHGVRNIVFPSPNPTAPEGLQTWIRMEDGETHAWITLDKNYN